MRFRLNFEWLETRENPSTAVGDGGWTPEQPAPPPSEEPAPEPSDPDPSSPGEPVG